MSFIDMMANSLLENSNLVWTTASNGASRRDLIYDLVLFQITGVNGVRHHLKALGMT